MEIIDKLVEYSNRYGKRNDLVLAGGGNTSAKDSDILYVKGSGVSLAEIKADGFVKMDRKKLAAIFDKTYSSDDKQREAEALSDLMNARLSTELNKRPSVETTLHSLFPQTFVLHLHPALINGLSCAIDGAKIANELFGSSALWVDACKPGYILAKLCKDAMDAYKLKYGKELSVLLLQNHGIFLAANSVEELDSLLCGVLDKLNAKIKRLPDFSPISFDETAAEQLKAKASTLYSDSAVAVFECTKEISKLVKDASCAEIMLKPFTPDHIVYCKANPLFTESLDTLEKDFCAYKSKYGYAPKIIMLKGVGFAAVANNEKQALTAAMLFNDAIKIAVYTESFGGALHMTDELTDFIVNWEVESYRQKQN